MSYLQKIIIIRNEGYEINEFFLEDKRDNMK